MMSCKKKKKKKKKKKGKKEKEKEKKKISPIHIPFNSLHIKYNIESRYMLYDIEFWTTEKYHGEGGY